MPPAYNNFELSEYEFPIPTSHVRAEEISKLGKTDVRINSGRLLIAIDIPLLDMAGYQLYEIYAHPVYQQISQKTTGSIYIIPKTLYIALAHDERKFFLISKEYYNNCQKTFYNTIFENTQPKHEVPTTTSCELFTSIRPSKDTIRLCDIRIKGYLRNSGLLRLGTGCTARMTHTTLTGTQINKKTEEYIYNPNFTS